MNGPNAEKAVSIINLFILIGFAILRSSGQKEPGGSEDCGWGLACLNFSIWELLVCFRTKQAGWVGWAFLFGWTVWGRDCSPVSICRPFQSQEYCSTVNSIKGQPFSQPPSFVNYSNFVVAVSHNLGLAAISSHDTVIHVSEAEVRLPGLWYHRMGEVERFAPLTKLISEGGDPLKKSFCSFTLVQWVLWKARCQQLWSVADTGFVGSLQQQQSCRHWWMPWGLAGKTSLWAACVTFSLCAQDRQINMGRTIELLTLEQEPLANVGETPTSCC